MSRLSTNHMAKPRLIAFDLDCTLWPFHVDTHVDPPFKKTPDGKIYDSRGWKIKCFPDVPDVLEQLHAEGYHLAAASRTYCTEEAKDLVKLFGWEKYFHYKEIYPGCKKTHFKRFQQLSSFAYSDMLFFDDERRNIVDCDSIGVTSIYVRHGVTKTLIQEGLAEFAARKEKGT